MEFDKLINYCDHCMLYFCRFVCFLIAFSPLFSHRHRPRYEHHHRNRHRDVTNQTIRLPKIKHYGIEERRRYNQEKEKARWWSINFLLALNVK